MPRTVEEILQHADELAERFADYEPDPADERDPAAYLALRQAALARSDAEREVRAAVSQARTGHFSWNQIGTVLGTTGEAARQRYASSAAPPTSQ